MTGEMFMFFAAAFAGGVVGGAAVILATPGVGKRAPASAPYKSVFDFPSARGYGHSERGPEVLVPCDRIIKPGGAVIDDGPADEGWRARRRPSHWEVWGQQADA